MEKICHERYSMPLHCTVIYCTAIYCTTLHCTIIYCNILYYSALHYMPSKPAIPWMPYSSLAALSLWNIPVTILCLSALHCICTALHFLGLVVYPTVHKYD